MKTYRKRTLILASFTTSLFIVFIAMLFPPFLIGDPTMSEWQKETVDDAGNVGGYTSIAVATSGNWAVSYYDFTNANLKFANFNGTTWNIETVDSVGNVGLYTSLASNTLVPGEPFISISYYDKTHRDLKFAFFDGTVWNIETVDSAGNVGLFTSLASVGFVSAKEWSIQAWIIYNCKSQGNLEHTHGPKWIHQHTTTTTSTTTSTSTTTTSTTTTTHPPQPDQSP